MTDPAGAQSGATGVPQSGDPANPGAVTDPATGGQSAAGANPQNPAEGGQSAVSREDYEKLQARLQAADRRASENEAALKQLRDKDMPEMQKLQRDLTEAQNALKELQAANSALVVENAFLQDNDYDWHSPAAALRLLDRSKVTVDDQGSVAGMKDALKALATANPFMLKPKAADADGGTGAATSPPPGTSPANGGINPQTGSKTDVKAAASRFPAMRQRLG